MPSAVDRLLAGQQEEPTSAVDRLLASSRPTSAVDRLIEIETQRREFDPDKFASGLPWAPGVPGEVVKGAWESVKELAGTSPLEWGKGLTAGLAQVATMPLNYLAGERSHIRDAVASVADQQPAISGLPFGGGVFRHAQEMRGERGLKFLTRADEALESERNEAIETIQGSVDRTPTKQSIPWLMGLAEVVGVPETALATGVKLGARGARTAFRASARAAELREVDAASTFLQKLAVPTDTALDVAEATGRAPKEVIRESMTELRDLESLRNVAPIGDQIVTKDVTLAPVVAELSRAVGADVAKVGDLPMAARRSMAEMLPELVESNPGFARALVENPQFTEAAMVAGKHPYLPGGAAVQLRRRIGAFAMKWLAPEGNAYEHAAQLADPEGRRFLQQGIPRAIEDSNNLEKSILLGLYGPRADLELAMSRAVESGRYEGTLTELNEALFRSVTKSGRRNLDKFPPEVAREYERVLDARDALTRKMAGEGLFDANVMDEVIDLEDRYLHRNYRIFRDPEYSKQVEGSVQWDRMKAWLMKHRTDGDSDAAERWMYDLVNGYVDQRKAAQTWSRITRSKEPSNKLEGADLFTIMERQNVPKTVREFMGEPRGFLENFDVTATVLARDIARVTTERQMLDELTRLGYAIDPQAREASGLFNNWQIKAFSEGKPNERVLALLPEAKAAMENVQSVIESTVRWGVLGAFSGGVKVGKVLNPWTIQRNYASNSMTALFSGQALKPSFWPDLARSSGRSIKVSGTGRIPEGVLVEEVDLARRGVTQTDPLTGELNLYERQLRSGRSGRALRAAGQYVPSRVKSAGKEIKDILSRFFVEGDSAWKRPVYFGYRDDYTDAVRLADDDGLTEIRKVFGTADPEAMAAEITKQVMQTYSRAPLFSKRLSEFPILGPFATFPAVSASNYIMAMKQLALHAKLAATVGGEAGQVFAGMARRSATGLLAVHMMPVAVKEGIQAVAGDTFTTDQQEALNRQVSRPWNEHSDKTFIPVNGWRQVAYYDWGTLDYYESTRDGSELLLKFLSTGDGADLVDFAEFLESQFASWELPAKSGLETITNQRLAAGPGSTAQRWIFEDEKLRENVDSDLPTGPKLAGTGYRVYRNLAPGAIILAENLARAAGNETGIWENTDPFGIERGAREFMPFGRFTEIDVEGELRAFSSRVGERLKGNRSALYGAVRDGDSKFYGDLRKKMEREIWPEIEATIKDYATFVPADDLRKLLYESGVPWVLINYALSEDEEEFPWRVYAPEGPDFVSIENRLRAAREEWE